MSPSKETEPSSPSQQDKNVIAAIAALLLVGASTRAVTPRVATILAPLGITAATASSVVRAALRSPITPPLPPGGKAMAELPAMEAFFRAAYILQASRRVQQAQREGRDLQRALHDEARYFQLHLQAQGRRIVASKRVDDLVERYGPKLGWYAKMDHRTSPECRAANGKNFTIDERPAIGYPGAVHPHCRCVAGKPHARGATLPGRKVA